MLGRGVCVAKGTLRTWRELRNQIFIQQKEKLDFTEITNIKEVIKYANMKI
jgi:hypothetical protein